VGSGRARILVLALGAFVVVAGTARGQDREPSRDDPSERNFLLRPTRTNREPSPPSTYDPSDEAPPPDAAPPPVAPRPEPKPGAPAPTESPSSPDDIVIKANGRVRLELGYDSNVFRAERGASGDGFFHGYGEAQVLVTFPEERELFASVSGEGLYYFKDPIANETYASTFVDYYHPLSPIFDVDVQNTFEYSAQNLLDDNGDLLPRAKFDAYDEEARATLIAHLGPRVSLELSGGGRFKSFEDNPGLPSLSYWEARGSAGIRYKVWTDGRLKVRYVFRERQYTDLPANLRDGTSVAGDPKLELQRHQIVTTFSQRAELFGMRFVAQLGYYVTYNKDTFQNDRSYMEHSVSAHLEWWPIATWTAFDFDVRGGDRSFLVRRTLVRTDPRFGTALEQSYCEITISAWQRLLGPPTRGPDGDFTSAERGLCLALVGDVSWYLYHSTDIRSSYGRFVVELGLEASF